MSQSRRGVDPAGAPAYMQPYRTCNNCGCNMRYASTRAMDCPYCGSRCCSPGCFSEHLETLHPDHLDDHDDPHYYTND